MNTRNAFHGLDEGLNTLAPKFEPAKLSFQTRTKSLLDEDDYFRANLPPTYDMEPLPVDAFAVDEKIVSKAATKGGLDHPAEMFVFYFLFFVIFLAIRYD